MHDVAVRLENRPGALAEMGEALGRAGVSVEGGGGFVVGGTGITHFLFKDGQAARKVLEAAKIEVLGVRDVLVQHLRQDMPGQLGMIARRMADAGVNIEVVYSDHENQLILVVDKPEKGRAVSRTWEEERGRGIDKRPRG
jgi:hypothetical protein